MAYRVLEKHAKNQESLENLFHNCDSFRSLLDEVKKNNLGLIRGEYLETKIRAATENNSPRFRIISSKQDFCIIGMSVKEYEGYIYEIEMILHNNSNSLWKIE